MLFVMSLRTTPLSASTFGPLEPSPGNGPAVSSGISVVASPPLAVAEVVRRRGRRSAAAVRGEPQAASASEPMLPANTVTARRRLISLGRSNCSPRSWSSIVASSSC